MTRLKTFLLGDRFLGIEYFTENGKDQFVALEARQKKNNLVIMNYEQLGKFEEIINTNYPIYLAINTSQVLCKEIESFDTNDLRLVQKAFPNLSDEDFYFEIWRLENKTLVFICRKEYVNSILKKIKQQKVKLFGFSLGLACVSTITPFLKEDLIRTNTSIIDLKSSDRVLTTVTGSHDVDYNLNGLQVNNKNIVSFSAALYILLSNNQSSGNVSLENEIISNNYFQTTFFSKGFQIMVCFLLGILLANFFIFNHYFKKAQEASEFLMMNKTSVERIKSLKDDIKLKEERLVSFSKLNTFKTSVILNEIAKSVPTSILLDNLTYNPLQKRVKENEQILIENNTLFLSGNSMDKTDFTDWITFIENLSWTSSVAIVQYGSESAKGESFEIKIIRHDEVRDKK